MSTLNYIFNQLITVISKKFIGGMFEESSRCLDNDIDNDLDAIIGGRFSYGGFSNGDDLRIRGVCGNMGVSGYSLLYFGFCRSLIRWNNILCVFLCVLQTTEKGFQFFTHSFFWHMPRPIALHARNHGYRRL